MLAIALFTASILLFVLAAVLARALDYVRQHPEALAGGSALAYEQCQTTLQEVIERGKEIVNSPATLIAWQAPDGNYYTVSGEGIEERRPGGSRAYHLAWQQIGGIGIQMQPGFRLAEANWEGYRHDTTGYSFYVLIVPHSGHTMTIRIPTSERPDAVNFVAQTLTLAGQFKKRINVFGFNKPPASRYHRAQRPHRPHKDS